MLTCKILPFHRTPHSMFGTAPGISSLLHHTASCTSSLFSASTRCQDPYLCSLSRNVWLVCVVTVPGVCAFQEAFLHCGPRNGVRKLSGWRVGGNRRCCVACRLWVCWDGNTTQHGMTLLQRHLGQERISASARLSHVPTRP